MATYTDAINAANWKPPVPATKQAYEREYNAAKAAGNSVLAITIKQHAFANGVLLEEYMPLRYPG